ncbi:MAG: PEP-CTERM sorting domain-containing protein [Phycisphaerales bacterium JB037]
MKMRNLGGIAAATLLAAHGLASADPVELFHDDFERGSVKPQWSGNTLLNFESRASFSWFSGRYTNDTVTLTLPAYLPPRDDTNGGDGGSGGSGDDGSGGGGSGGDGSGDGGKGGDGNTVRYSLLFDLYIIDSWDGDDSGFGRDEFGVAVNGNPLFRESFANQHTGQSFREPDLGRWHMGFNNARPDSIYRNIELGFTVEAAERTLRIDFTGYGLQTLSDESWGIDNVRVYAEVVPAPGSLAVMSLAGLGLARRRR